MTNQNPPMQGQGKISHAWSRCLLRQQRRGFVFSRSKRERDRTDDSVDMGFYILGRDPAVLLQKLATGRGEDGSYLGPKEMHVFGV